MSGNNKEKKYDVALSFAGEDRTYVSAVAKGLRKRGINVFYDEFEEADLAGKNLVHYLEEIYRDSTKLCVLFISEAYVNKTYPCIERQAALAGESLSTQPYIIPVRLDETEIPGLHHTTGYIRKKTPERLSDLIYACFIRDEKKGIKSTNLEYSGDSVIIRFRSLFEPDIHLFTESLKKFDHWPKGNLDVIPIELRIPDELEQEINTAINFRESDAWLSEEISDGARQMFNQFYDEMLPDFISKMINGVQLLVFYYSSLEYQRLEMIIEHYLLTKIVVFVRLLGQYRIIEMPPSKLGAYINRFATTWGLDLVMKGLPYICYTMDYEQFLWVDIDAYDSCPSTIWPHARFRLFAPSNILLKDSLNSEISEEEFDRYFALQLLEKELEGDSSQPLQYFCEYPEMLTISIRGECAIETEHFAKYDTSNNGGKPLYSIVCKLKEHVLSKPQYIKSKYQGIYIIKRLFRNSHYYDEVLSFKN